MTTNHPPSVHERTRTASRRHFGAGRVVAAVATCAVVSTLGAVGLASPAAAAPGVSFTQTNNPLPIVPNGLAVDPGVGATYAIGSGQYPEPNRLLILDADARQVTGSVDIGTLPRAVAVDTSSHLVYVAQADTSSADGSVLVIAPAEKRVVATIPVSPDPFAIAVDEATHTAYVTGGYTDGKISVIDTQSRTVITTVPTGPSPNAIALDRTARTAYVSSSGTRNSNGTSIVRAAVDLLDMRSNQIVATLTADENATVGKVGIDESAHRAYIPHGSAGTVDVVDTGTRRVVATISELFTPGYVDVDPATHTLFIGQLGAISVYDSTTYQFVNTFLMPDFIRSSAINTQTHTYYAAYGIYNGGISVLRSGPGTSACPNVLAPVSDKYAELGGCSGFLGKALTGIAGIKSTASELGLYTRFEGGDIYYSQKSGIHVVRGAIRDRWLALGGVNGQLGFPTTDELTTPDTVGRYNHFQGGSVYFTPRTGAHEVYGAIRDYWAGNGYEAGPFGYPVTGEFDFLFGRISVFERGFIYWNPSTGIVAWHW